MTPETVLNVMSFGMRITEVAMDVIANRNSPAGAVRRLLDLGLEVLPVEEMQQYLTDAARCRAELVVDAASAAKFGQR